MCKSIVVMQDRALSHEWILGGLDCGCLWRTFTVSTVSSLSPMQALNLITGTPFNFTSCMRLKQPSSKLLEKHQKSPATSNLDIVDRCQDDGSCKSIYHAEGRWSLSIRQSTRSRVHCSRNNFQSTCCLQASRRNRGSFSEEASRLGYARAS